MRVIFLFDTLWLLCLCSYMYLEGLPGDRWKSNIKLLKLLSLSVEFLVIVFHCTQTTALSHALLSYIFSSYWVAFYMTVRHSWFGLDYSAGISYTLGFLYTL